MVRLLSSQPILAKKNDLDSIYRRRETASCLLILGAVSSLEPSLKELLPPFCDLNPDPTKLVDLLGLNFDPRIELEKRATEAATSQETHNIPLLTDADTEYLKKIREETVK
jgi:Family of unknown function (DUF5331)